MTRHIESGDLQDLLEGLLASERASEVRRHLEECSECRGEFDFLDRMMADTKGLPAEATPSRDLWPQIAWRLEGAARETTGGREELEATPASAGLKPAVSARDRTGRAREVGGPHWVSVPAWQLLAAGIALIFLSGGSVWAFFALNSGSGVPMDVPGPEVGTLVGWEEAYQGYDEAVADLEAVLEQGRDVLDPETVRVLEENLRAIDAAIQDAEEVLAKDPSSSVVRRLLSDSLRRKVDLLRQVADVVYSIS